MNKLIFGKETTQNIVNLTLKNDQLYIYTETEGKVNLEIIPYSPWVLSHGPVNERSEQLKGKQFWNNITTTTSAKFEALQEKWQRNLWLPRSVEECATLAEGFTYFKGMKVNDVSILSFDIETSGLAHDETSEVFLISNTFRKQDNVIKKLFSIEEYENDVEMIKSWCKWVKEIDPSILCGHNILSYDLPYLNWIMTGQGVNEPLSLGRDESAMEFADKESQFRKDSSQKYTYHNVRITGREIVDTFFLSLKYDIGRQFPSYGLKPIVKHLGLEKSDRTFIDASKIREYYKERGEMWEKTKLYAAEDSDDSLKLFDVMAPSYFYLAQSIPKSFQQMINEASGGQLDALMVRSYLQDGFSQPRTSTKAPFEGAISMGIPGVYEHVLKADVAALYPSIMLEYNIHDNKKDPNNYMIQLLTYFRTERLMNKKKAKETGEQYFDDLQNAQKIMINSMYGFLGAGYLLYNYPAGATEVTKRGREILLKGVEWATGYTLNHTIKKIVNKGKENEEIEYEWTLGEKISEGRGYRLANVDTDSFSITNGQPTTDTEFESVLKELNTIYPKTIEWAHDGIYEKVIVIGAKNYVLVKKGKVKFKGSAITDQKKEPALTEMLKSMVQSLLDEEMAALPYIYKRYVNEVLNITDIKRWAVKKTVTKSVLSPDRLTEQKVLDAINETVECDVIEGIQEGDKVWLYNAIDGERQAIAKGQPVFYKDGRPKMIPNTFLRDVRMWESDHDKAHYLMRVSDTAAILGSILNMDQFVDYNQKSVRDELLNLTRDEKYDKIS